MAMVIYILKPPQADLLYESIKCKIESNNKAISIISNQTAISAIDKENKKLIKLLQMI
jgi:hypothetical protein